MATATPTRPHYRHWKGERKALTVRVDADLHARLLGFAEALRARGECETLNDTVAAILREGLGVK